MKRLLCRSSVRLIALVMIASFGVSACSDGEGNFETVYLYLINGYTGSSSMSFIGPTGTLASGVKFADRVGDDGVCPAGDRCLPATMDRSLGTEITMIADGTPTPVQLDTELFGMYPHETGTLVVTDRTDEGSFNSYLFRHVQTTSNRCVLTVVNALSLDNTHVTGEMYTWSPEFQMAKEDAGYVDESERPFTTTCGDLPVGEGLHDSLARSELLSEIESNNWFFPVECEDADLSDLTCFAYGEPSEVDGVAILHENGEFRAHRSSDQYYDCVQAAITIKQPEDEMATEPQQPVPADAQVQCPDGDITWSDVQVDAEQVAECGRTEVKQAKLVSPGGEEGRWSLISDECNYTVRPRSLFLDTVFGPEGLEKGAQGYHGPDNSDLIVSQIEIHPGSEHFYVMIGRPVNPIIWQWDSGEAFLDFRDDGYLNDKEEEIGEYDYPR